MKSKASIITNLGVAALFLFGSSFAVAQSQQIDRKEQKQQTVQEQQPGQQGQGQKQAQQFMGKEVTTQTGENLGTVENAVQDNEGNIRYVILSRGQGQNKITIPFDKISQQDDKLSANVDLSGLQQFTGQQQDQQVNALDQILGKSVQGQQGEELGTIENIVVGTGSGTMVILTGEDQEKYPIPLQALKQQQGQEGFSIDQNKENFRTAPSYAQDFPDLEQWQNVIHGYYGVEPQQQPQTQQQQQPQAQQQQQQPGQDGADITVQQPAPQVQVEQPQPEVQVRQPQPEVTVTQPQPQVEVTQPQPQVQVRQPEPEVSVEQAQPQVRVKEQGQPEVTVQRQGQPEVTVQRQGEPQVEVQREQQKQADRQQQGETADQADASQAQNWINQPVKDKNGQELGTVSDIETSDGKVSYILIQAQQDDQIHPVPADLLRTDPQEQGLQANFDQQFFQQSPGFSAEQQQQMAQQEWEQEVRGYYQEQQGGQPQQQQRQQQQ